MTHMRHRHAPERWKLDRGFSCSGFISALQNYFADGFATMAAGFAFSLRRSLRGKADRVPTAQSWTPGGAQVDLDQRPVSGVMHDFLPARPEEADFLMALRHFLEHHPEAAEALSK
jgi:hypothetical protein